MTIDEQILNAIDEEYINLCILDKMTGFCGDIHKKYKCFTKKYQS